MSLIYITGISGSGKSTIKDELIKRGYPAFDVDDGTFKAWYNRETDQLAQDQKTWKEAEADRTWHEQHWLKVERSRVEELRKQSLQNPSPVFLTGTTPNDKDIWDLFNKVIFLRVGNEALKHRILTRTNNSYGKHPDDLKDILEWNKDAEALNVQRGALVVDAEQALSKVVDSILELSD
jgi:dephospho-CoA kinase